MTELDSSHGSGVPPTHQSAGSADQPTSDLTRSSLEPTGQSNSDGFVSPVWLDSVSDAGDKKPTIVRDNSDPRTVDQTNPSGEATDGTEPMPKWIGRYQVIERLGAGGFGAVYLAKDETLRRKVSIKVPHRHLLKTRRIIQLYMDEAMMVAQVEHPKVVPVYDVGQTDDGVCYIVSKYIESETLADQIMRGIDPQLAVRIAIDLAETLQQVHEKGIVHRDVKPANILISQDGEYFLNDFGLAVIEVNPLDRGRIVGTPAYMSPEQAQGEGHLVDGRSDVFSLGVILYEMLAGRRPFRGGTMQQVVYQIRKRDPKPIRQLNRNLPNALERVCQKALAKSVVARYRSAIEFAEDLSLVLERWDIPSSQFSTADQGDTSAVPGDAGSQDLSSNGSAGSQRSSSLTQDEQNLIVIPKGLRSYDQTDAAFFQAMLPGPYDVNGCPESILFWKNRIDPTGTSSNANLPSSYRGRGIEPFRVGVIYGTSGCGKSSFIQAGLLPTLDLSVTVCAVEANEKDLIRRISKTLSRLVPTFEEVDRGNVDPADSDEKINISLDQRMASIRRGENLPSGTKVLIVIDQFEQWLNTADDEEWSKMVRALRQCDGHRLQAILLVRDDFWLATSRLMRELDIELSASHNLAMIDLIDLPHAEKLLRMLGRAYDCIGRGRIRLQREERLFVQEAVASLASGNRVVAVQLALFAEMMKSRPWTRATLRNLKGIDRVVEQFLHESFDTPQAPRSHRQHSKAAHAALTAMLPETGLIRGSSIQWSQLADATGYDPSSESMSDLIRVLDQNLKLITPVESESLGGGAEEHTQLDRSQGSRRYQLTHDSLVPAIRRWVDQRHNATLAGRAKLSLKRRAQAWSSGKDKRQLPSIFQWIWYGALVRRKMRSDSEQRMMSAASRRHMLSLGIAMATLLSVVIGWQFWRTQSLTDRLSAQLSIANTSQLPTVLDEIQQHASAMTPRLLANVESRSHSRRSRFLSALALPNDQPVPRQLVQESLLKDSLDLLRFVRGHRPDWVLQHQTFLLDVLSDETAETAARMRAGLMLAAFYRGDIGKPSLEVEQAVRSHSQFLASSIVDESMTNKLMYADLVELAKPLRQELSSSFSLIAGHADRDISRDSAVILIRDLHADDVTQMVLASLDLPSTAFQAIVDGTDWSRVDFATLDQTSPNETTEEAFPGRRLGRLEAIRILATYPSSSGVSKMIARSTLYESLSKLTESPQGHLALATFLHITVHSSLPNELYFDRSFEMNSDLRCTQMFCVGLRLPNLSLGEDDSSDQDPLTPQQVELASQASELAKRRLKMDADPAEFSAALWLLSRLGEADWAKEQLAEFSSPIPKEAVNSNRRIRVNSLSHPMVLFPAGTVAAQSTEGSESEIEFSDLPLDYPIEFSIDEVTVDDYLKKFPYYGNIPDLSSQHPDSPAGVIMWEQAVDYCQWLSEQEGLPKEQWAYRKKSDGSSELKPNFKSLAGYRLPTAREWVAIWEADPSRAACVMDDELCQYYACILPYSGDVAEPIGGFLPDRHGIFHLPGNHEEWCSDRFHNNRSIRGNHFAWGLEERGQIATICWRDGVINWVRIGFRVVRSGVPADGDPAGLESENPSGSTPGNAPEESPGADVKEQPSQTSES